MSDEPKQSTPRAAPDQKALAPATEAGGLTCPTCGGVVDPRRTTQALSRNARLMLFCTSGCLRTFLAEERAKKEGGP